MKVTRVLHVSRNVEGRLAEVRQLYVDVLGLPTADRPHIPGIDGAWLQLGDGQVHLVDAPAGDGPIRPAGDHWCFGVEDLDAAIAELEARGIDYQRGAQGDVVQIWFADPVGGTIELQQDQRA